MIELYSARKFWYFRSFYELIFTQVKIISDNVNLFDLRHFNIFLLYAKMFCLLQNLIIVGWKYQTSVKKRISVYLIPTCFLENTQRVCSIIQRIFFFVHYSFRLTKKTNRCNHITRDNNGNSTKPTNTH